MTSMNLISRSYRAPIFLSCLCGTLSAGCLGPDAILGTNASGGAGPSAGTGGAGGVVSAAPSTGGTPGVGGSSNDCNGVYGNGCALQQVAYPAANMLLVIDESGSMNNYTTSSGNQSKWSEMKTALNAALVPVQNSINFGLELFPYDPAGPIDGTATDPSTYCQVPQGSAAIAVAINTDASSRAGNLQRILDTVNSAVPAGGTPTAAALDQAYVYFTQGNGANLVGSKWILLATDGGPNCNASLACTADTCTQNLDNLCAAAAINCCANNPDACLDDQSVVTKISALAAIGINTFVVGLPGSEAYAATLNVFAQAGNVPNPNGASGEAYYGVSASNSLAGLEEALTAITSLRVVSCDIPLATTPPDPNNVSVFIDCTAIPKLAADASSDAGWFVDYSVSPAHLVFVGQTCGNIQTSGAQRIDIIGGCPGNAP